MGKRHLIDTNIIVYYLDGLLTAAARKFVKRALPIRQKYKKLKLPDAIIAATAAVHNLSLISRNLSDFAFIKEITVIDPFKL